LQKQACSLFVPQEQVLTVEHESESGLLAAQVGGFAWHAQCASLSLLPEQTQ